MSRFYSYVEESSPQAYRPRWAAAVLRAHTTQFPVTVLTGARQVGKSTLLRREEPFRDWTYVTLDDFDALEAATKDPSSLWSSSKYVVLDEVQKAPALLDAVKRAVDVDPQRRFVLSGSANLLLMSKVTESLAGRATFVELGPMTVGEMESRPAPRIIEQLLRGEAPDPSTTPTPAPDPISTAWRGMMPRFLTLPEQSVPAWWDGYVTTYLERDLRTLSQVSSLPEFRRLMEAVALRQGQLLNRSEIARDLRLAQATVHRHIDLLEASEAATLLPAFAGTDQAADEVSQALPVRLGTDLVSQRSLRTRVTSRIPRGGACVRGAHPPAHRGALSAHHPPPPPALLAHHQGPGG